MKCGILDVERCFQPFLRTPQRHIWQTRLIGQVKTIRGPRRIELKTKDPLLSCQAVKILDVDTHIVHVLTLKGGIDAKREISFGVVFNHRVQTAAWNSFHLRESCLSITSCPGGMLKAMIP